MRARSISDADADTQLWRCELSDGEWTGKVLED